jgi:hypothetical protein
VRLRTAGCAARCRDDHHRRGSGSPKPISLAVEPSSGAAVGRNHYSSHRWPDSTWLRPCRATANLVSNRPAARRTEGEST